MDPNVLHNISYGMYIVSSFKKDALNGQIANSVFQITSEPAAVAVSINKKNLTHEYITSSGRFSVSVLDETTPLSFIGKFGFKSGKNEEKFRDVRYKILGSGCPAVTDNSICFLEAKVTNAFDCVTHTLFLGEMTEGEILKQGKAMTYDYYHEVKRGTTPANAPTFIKEEMPGARPAPGMQKYRCTVCNYIYDPAIGDPNGGIAPGTPFERIPDDWRCPVCGVDKTKFVIEE